MVRGLWRMILAGGLLVALTECGSDEDLAVRVAQLTEGCRLDSDCAEPLVCTFKTCHEECTATRDCPAGERCVAGKPPRRVCQATIECRYNSECPGEQACALDNVCRDECVNARDCGLGQLCRSGTCVEPAELDAYVAVTEVGGVPCTFNSDCRAPLVCLRGECRIECRADRDCLVGVACVDNRCDLAALATAAASGSGVIGSGGMTPGGGAGGMIAAGGAGGMISAGGAGGMVSTGGVGGGAGGLGGGTAGSAGGPMGGASTGGAGAGGVGGASTGGAGAGGVGGVSTGGMGGGGMAGTSGTGGTGGISGTGGTSGSGGTGGAPVSGSLTGGIAVRGGTLYAGESGGTLGTGIVRCDVPGCTNPTLVGNDFPTEMAFVGSGELVYGEGGFIADEGDLYACIADDCTATRRNIVIGRPPNLWGISYDAVHNEVIFVENGTTISNCSLGGCPVPGVLYNVGVNIADTVVVGDTLYFLQRSNPTITLNSCLLPGCTGAMVLGTGTNSLASVARRPEMAYLPGHIYFAVDTGLARCPIPGGCTGTPPVVAPIGPGDTIVDVADDGAAVYFLVETSAASSTVMSYTP